MFYIDNLATSLICVFDNPNILNSKFPTLADYGKA